MKLREKYESLMSEIDNKLKSLTKYKIVFNDPELLESSNAVGAIEDSPSFTYSDGDIDAMECKILTIDEGQIYVTHLCYEYQCWIAFNALDMVQKLRLIDLIQEHNSKPCERCNGEGYIEVEVMGFNDGEEEYFTRDCPECTK